MEDQISCPHLNGNICELATWMSNKQRNTTQETCEVCSRCNKPQDVNEVVIALAGIETTTKGPGTTLKKTLSWFVPMPPNCNCVDREQLMNHWGYERCKQEKRTILNWLRESALDNNYPYSEFVISYVVDKCIDAHKPK